MPAPLPPPAATTHPPADREPADRRRPSDTELLHRVRNGDMDAYGTLFVRHRAAAHRYAVRISRSQDHARELTGEAFTRVLQALLAGSGPSMNFLGYVLTTIRRTAGEWARVAARTFPVADLAELAEFERGFAPEAAMQAMTRFEHRTVSRAFTSLPARWRTVLWHTAVEGATSAETGRMMGVTPSGVAALAYRAREGLRRAYLTQHVRAKSADCRTFVARFGAQARGGLADQAARHQERHLRECPSCVSALTEVREVEQLLRGTAGPLVLLSTVFVLAHRTGCDWIRDLQESVLAGDLLGASSVWPMAADGVGLGGYLGGYLGTGALIPTTGVVAGAAILLWCRAFLRPCRGRGAAAPALDEVTCGSEPIGPSTWQ